MRALSAHAGELFEDDIPVLRVSVVENLVDTVAKLNASHFVLKCFPLRDMIAIASTYVELETELYVDFRRYMVEESSGFPRSK
jgi:hypothetical protein